jgi:hypothetical protein
VKFYTVTVHHAVSGMSIEQRVFGAENIDQLLSGIKRFMTTADVDKVQVTQRLRGPIHGRVWTNVLTGRDETDPTHYQVHVPNHHDFDSILCGCGKWWPCEATSQ